MKKIKFKKRKKIHKNTRKYFQILLKFNFETINWFYYKSTSNFHKFWNNKSRE